MSTLDDALEGTGFSIRRACPCEARELTDFAYASKRSWGYPENELDDDCGPLTVTPGYIRENTVFVAEDDRRILGFFSLIPTDRPDVIELDHFWVNPETRGRGVGRAMFGRVRNEALRLGMRTLFIVSDPNAEAFYLRAGAIRTGDTPACSGERRLPTLELPLQPKETSTPSGE
jgi:predicted GNAT family acetyltransferase